jgi:Kef-type K+ transport system membrane component KefB
MHYLSEQNIYLFLVQLFLLLFLARGLGEVFRHYHQPPLTAEILVGVLLGPTVFGRFFPGLREAIFPNDPIQNYMLETIAWLGIFFLLLESGLEMDFATAMRQSRNALKIAVMGIAVPMVIVFVFAFFIPASYLVDPSQRIMFSLFMSTVLSITAITIVARTLKDLSLNKTDFGLLVMTALSINDILGWLILTVVLVLFASGEVVISQIVMTLGAVAIFVLLALSVGRIWTDKLLTRIKFHQMPEPSTSLTFICLLGILCGAVTQKIGIHALLGFLIAGVMASGARALSERTRHIISQMVNAIFVPLFFASIGLRLDFFQNFDFFLAIFITIISVAAKFMGAYTGASFSTLARDLRMPIAIAHIPGGMMEIVIGMLALEQGWITEKMFVAIIISSVASSILVGPWLTWAFKRRREIPVVEYLLSRLAVSDLKANEKESAIAKLCEAVSLQQNMPSCDIITESVISRERDMGTALGFGVSVPHARLNAIKRPMIIFGRSLAGIEWDAPDGKPVHFIFLILTSDQDDPTQIQILRSIAIAMSYEKIRNKLMEAKDAKDLGEILNEALIAQSIKSIS